MFSCIKFSIRCVFYSLFKCLFQIIIYIIQSKFCHEKYIKLNRYIECSVPPVMDTPSPCANSPCGANAICKERNGVGSCACLPEYYGDPYTGCRPECVQNSECDQTKACVNNKCVDPCPGVCPPNASKFTRSTLYVFSKVPIQIRLHFIFSSIFQFVLFEIMHQIASVITVLPVILRSLVVELKSVSFE